MTRQSNPDPRDSGFTLIELMVVLVIIAILLAVAIPTFLGARDTANARSTQENLRNALTAEQTSWAKSQTFATAMSSIEPELVWTTTTVSSSGGSTVGVALYNWNSGSPSSSAASSYDGVELVGYAKDGYCYAVFQSDNSAKTFTAYTRWSASASPCAAQSPPAGSALPLSGSAASVTSSGGWYASF